MIPSRPDAFPSFRHLIASSSYSRVKDSKFSSQFSRVMFISVFIAFIRPRWERIGLPLRISCFVTCFGVTAATLGLVFFSVFSLLIVALTVSRQVYTTHEFLPSLTSVSCHDAVSASPSLTVFWANWSSL